MIIIESTTTATNPEVEAVWRDFWEDLVTTDGNVDIQLIKNELYDYHTAIEEVSTVYCEITNNRISKPNTRAAAVLDIYREDVDRQVEAAVLPYRALVRGMVALWNESKRDRWSDEHEAMMQRLVDESAAHI